MWHAYSRGRETCPLLKHRKNWGGLGFSQTIEDAVNYAYNLGCVVVAAAGNSSMNALSFTPANCRNVITVAASDQNDYKYNFSNYGAKIDVAAPGIDILSLKASGTASLLGSVVGVKYVRMQGTSMAAPHVSGLAALLVAKYPIETPEQIRI